MTDPIPPIDNAVYGPLKGGAQDPTYAGVLSFMRRKLTRELDGVDVGAGNPERRKHGGRRPPRQGRQLLAATEQEAGRAEQDDRHQHQDHQVQQHQRHVIDTALCHWRGGGQRDLAGA